MNTIKLEDKIIESFTEYSTYVNEERAIPHVYDSLKPVARRLLYVMWKMNLTPEKQTRKSANVVGATMAYHAHGDSGIYGALARLAQPFSVKIPLVYGQGNFGSEEMPPAHMRYTEVKLSKLGYALTEKLKKPIVPMHPNYDGTETEPDFLFAPVPLLLNTGALGIGVGMQVSIPPHNLNEIIAATIHLLHNPNASTEDLLKHIQGPDFPSGCTVVNKEDFLATYTKGKGSFVTRATFEFTGNTLTIKNLPLYSLAAKIEEQIYKAKEEGIFREIVKVINTTAQKQELTIQLKSKFDGDTLIRDLCRLTDAERAIHLDLRAVDEGKPKQFTLLTYLRRWLDIYQELTRKELELEFSKISNKLEIAEGLKKALLHIDTIIALIKQSENRVAAKTGLMDMGFTDNQANAILDIKLSRLTKLEAVELDKEISELTIEAERLSALLKRKELFIAYLTEQLNKYMGYDLPRSSAIENSKFPKLVKVKQDKYYITFNQGIVRVTEEMPKIKHFVAAPNAPVLILTDNYIVPIKNNKEPVYTGVHGILGDKDVLHFSTDGYVKRTKAAELQVTRKGKATNQDKVFTVLQADTGFILMTMKSGKRIQFAVDDVPYSKRGAKGVIAVKLEGEQINQIELIAKPVKGVPIGRNKKLSK